MRLYRDSNPNPVIRRLAELPGVQTTALPNWILYRRHNPLPSRPAWIAGGRCVAWLYSGTALA